MSKKHKKTNCEKAIPKTEFHNILDRAPDNYTNQIEIYRHTVRNKDVEIRYGILCPTPVSGMALDILDFYVAARCEDGYSRFCGRDLMALFGNSINVLNAAAALEHIEVSKRIVELDTGKCREFSYKVIEDCCTNVSLGDIGNGNWIHDDQAFTIKLSDMFVADFCEGKR